MVGTLLLIFFTVLFVALECSWILSSLDVSHAAYERLALVRIEHTFCLKAFAIPAPHDP